MFDNLYTTKMSASKKVLQGRFSKMRQKNGRISKWMAALIGMALLLAVTFATVVLAGFNGDSRDNSSSIKSDAWGLLLTATNVTSRGADMVWQQAGPELNGELQFGTAYHIDRLENGEWQAVARLPGMEDAVFHQVAFKIPEVGDSVQFSLNWYPLYGELSPGTYRVYKEAQLYRAPGDFDQRSYYAEFTITDSMAYNPSLFVRPIADSIVSQPYGSRANPATGEVIAHNGIDWAAPIGTPVLSATAGNVFEVGFSNELGNYIVVESDNRIRTLYAHLDTIGVSQGAIVARGAEIGAVGNTGMSTGAHLHFEISVDGQYYNPELIF